MNGVIFYKGSPPNICISMDFKSIKLKLVACNIYDLCLVMVCCSSYFLGRLIKCTSTLFNLSFIQILKFNLRYHNLGYRFNIV